MEKCKLCPRNCGADRTAGKIGVCGMTAEMRIARAALHRFEEPPISGTRGSGTVFFVGCPLRCVFCQNRDISHGAEYGVAVTPQELARKVCQQIAERTPPQEMAMYIREGDPQAGSPAQELLDAIMGESVAQAPQANTQWAQQVFAEVGPQRPEAEAAE